MNFLYIRNFRCIQSCKFSSLCTSLRNHTIPIQSPVNSIFSKTPVCFTLTRKFSWEGFYTSLSLSTPVLTFQNIIIDFHNISGLPWWSVVMLTTLGIRSVFVFPLAVHQNQVINRLTNLNSELDKMAPQLNKEVNIAAKMYGWNEPEARKVFKKTMRQYYQKFILRDNCHPFKIFLLALFQVPVWICFSVSLRNLTMLSRNTHPDAQSLYQQLKIEGTLWFTDLTIPDIIIPFLLATVNLFLIEIHSLRKIGKGSVMQKALLYFMRFLVILVAGAAVLNPSSVSFYWLCSSIFGLAQSLLLMSPRVRHILRIPRTASESITPFRDIVSNFKKRFFSNT